MKRKRKKLGLKEIVLTGAFSLLSMLPVKAQEPSAPWVPFNFYNQPNNQEVIGKNKLEWYGSGDVNNDKTINYQDYIAMNETQNDMSDVDGDGIFSTTNDKQILKEYLDGDRNYLPSHWNELTAEEKISWYEKIEIIYKRDFPGEPEGIYWDCTERSRARLIDFSGFANLENYPDFYKYENIVHNGRFNIPLFMMKIRGSPYSHMINAIYVGNGKQGEILENILDDFYYIENNGTKIDPYNYIGFTETSRQTFYWEGYYEGVNYFGEPYKNFEIFSLLNWNLVAQEGVISSSIKDLILFDPAKYDTLTFEGIPKDKIVNFGKDISSYLEEEVAGVNSKLPTLKVNPNYEYVSINHANSEKINLGQEYNGEFYNYKYKRTAKAETPFMKDSTNWEIQVKDISPPKDPTFPEDNQINYSKDLDLENQINRYPSDAVDNSGLEATLTKSTHSTQIMNNSINQVNYDFYTDIKYEDPFENDTTYTHKTKVRDTESPKGDLSYNYIRREPGQSPEAAAKSLVENVSDNSELPIDTLVTNTTGNYYDVTLKDIAGNKNYLGNVQVDNPVGIENPSDLEKACGLKPYPNPNPYGIKYYQPDVGQTEISIYDVSGRQLKNNLYNSQAGENDIAFDKQNLAQGVYIIRMKTEGCKDSKKIVIDGRK